MKRAFKAIAGAVLFLLLAGYALASGYMAWNQRALIFRADPEPAPVARHNLPRAVDTALKAPDGTVLTGWTIVPANEFAPVYVYFHGNARNLSRRSERFRAMTAEGEGLVAFHYRGYGGSGGVPDEDALHRDAAAIYAETVRRFPRNPVILFGESLGSGVATRLAASVPSAALVLDSPFLSMQDRVHNLYPWLPVRMLLQHPFRSDLAMPKVAAPLLVLHGELDRIVPISEGRALFERASSPKEFRVYPTAGHVSAFSHGAAEHIRSFLRGKSLLPI